MKRDETINRQKMRKFRESNQSQYFPKIRIYSLKIMDCYNQIIIYFQMADRRSWTNHQDQVLKHLRVNINIKKWSEISKILESEYQILGRNGKQCRQRYNNHLMETINFTELSLQEEEKLFKLHNQIGNKWSCISKEFQGRTQNQIKNHFHSKLRKGVRKLNKEIKLYFKNTTKGFYKLNIVYKIVEASESRFGLKNRLDQENIQFFNDLKNYLLEYAGGKLDSVTKISSLSKKQQTSFLAQKVQTFQQKMKCSKLSFCREKPPKNNSKQKKSKIKRETSQTDNSHNSQSSKYEAMVDESEQSNDIYESASFQKFDQIDETNQFKKSANIKTSAESLASVEYIQTNKQEIGETKQCQQSRIRLQSGKIQYKNPLIINLLVQEEEIGKNELKNRLNFEEFESLREFEDSYLNDSQISWAMKKYHEGSEVDLE